MLNGLVASIEDKIEHYIQCLGEHIVKGTQLDENPDHGACRLSVGLISDFANNLQEKIKPYI